jgi:hypothetical protein
MNYLDILDDDLLNKIFDILADLYESEILIANNKLLKVKKLVSGLTIDADPEYYSVNYISYYNITYYIDNYLYSKYHLDNIIIIYRLKLIVNYNAENNTHTPIILKSKLLKKPLYLDILREIYNIYMEQTKIFGYYDNKRVLNNIIPVKKSEYNYYNINKNNNLNYITFTCDY